MRKFLKILGWTLLAFVLIVAGSLGVTVKLLTPERLTPLMTIAANKMLRADVSVGRAELKLKETYPFLNIRIDSLTVISRDMLALTEAEKDRLPAWADTLLSARSISGGINIVSLGTGKISLNDIAIDQLTANIVIVNDSLNNFTIMPPSDDEQADTTATEIPDIRIKSFAFTDRTRLRYWGAAKDSLGNAEIFEATIVNQDGNSLLTINSNEDGTAPYAERTGISVASPLLQMINRDNISIALDGTIDWKHDNPSRIRLSDFAIKLDEISATTNLTADFCEDPQLEAFDIDIKPMGISYLLSLISPEMAKEHGIPTNIKTDAAIALRAKLERSYALASGAIPYADLDINIAKSYLKWQKVDLRTLELALAVSLQGDDLNAMVADIEKFVIAGPATTINVTGTATQLIEDPHFKGYVNGHVVIDRLPPVLTAFLHGGSASGTIDMKAKVDACMSMFSRDGFHKLKIDGTIDANDLYYLSADTQTMLYARHAHAQLGTSTSREVQRRRRGSDSTVTIKMDSLLTASIKADSTQILAGGLAMRITDFSLGVGASNKELSADTTEIIPMGGKLTVGSFSLLTLSDSAGVRLRDLSGQVSMRRFRGNAHLPLFTLNAGIRRLSAGDNSTRFLLSGAELRARINKLPDTPQSIRRKEMRRTVDSIQRAHPDIPVDSVYAMARAIRRRHSTGHKRVRELEDADNNEIIDWGTSPALRSLLLDWDLRGRLTADNARLFTTAFPIRNRVDSLNIRFNNDSIVLDDLRYKAGRSDFLINGVVSNMQKAFTSRRRQPLEISLAMLSDTIDVNQLARAFFTGAAERDTKLGGDLDDEKSLEHAVDQTASTDSVGPLLIPVNIDGEFKIKANNVIYADFLLKNLSGQVLAYDGALSLYQLKAASDVGSINLSALYSAPQVDEMEFGMGLKLNDFRIGHFLEMVPAIDSIMPMLRDFDGIITANIAATSEVDPQMNLVLPTMNAAINLEGDSLVVIDEGTFKTIAKWLMFKNKNRNMIDHMSVNMVVQNNMLQIYPFMFDFDRYRLGVQGHNDLEMNFDYHVAVLKSPIPFTFGVNIKGNPDDFKIRLGKARFNANEAVQEVEIADTTRVNLIRQFENVFRRGVRESGIPQVHIGNVPTGASIDLSTDTLSAADSLYLQQQGLLPTKD